MTDLDELPQARAQAEESQVSDDRDYLFMGVEPDRLERARIYVAYREGPAPVEVESTKLWCVCRHGQKWCTPDDCTHKEPNGTA